MKTITEFMNGGKDIVWSDKDINSVEKFAKDNKLNVKVS